MHIPALIEYQGCIHFSLIGKDGFDLICPVASNKVRPIGWRADRQSERLGTPPPESSPEGYTLLAAGKLVEDTLRASGQWMDVLTFMAGQIEFAIQTRTPAAKRKHLRQQEKMRGYDFQAYLMGLKS